MTDHQRLKAIIKNLPTTPGVYIYKDVDGRILYVGKAINLKRRVSSYFMLKDSLGVKTKALIAQVHDIETIYVESEIEALLLEAKLIKTYKPPFNVQWIDDKDYLYIKITWKDAIPKVLTARREQIKGNIYFGPFPSAATVRFTLRTLRKTFPYCAERPTQMRKDGTNLYTDLGLCPGPHAGLMTPAEYRKHIKRLLLFLEGKKDAVVKELTREMQQASKTLAFEQAAKLKRQIDGIAYITSEVTLPQEYMENPDLYIDRREEELRQLKDVLHLPITPVRIEGYDISAIQGRHAVGSMVVFINAQPDKREYRKFRIKYTDIPKDVPNDFWMMREMLTRRLKNDWPIPDLLLIDGGKGQLSAVMEVMRDLKIDFPLASLAKRHEELYLPGDPDPIRLQGNSPALHLVTRVRDESHRFAITYHKQLRSKNFLQSQ